MNLYRELSGEDDRVLDVVVCADYRYFITATSEGNILVWKWLPQEQQLGTFLVAQSSTRRLIHTFQGHFKAVVRLMLTAQSPSLLLSVSLDSTARVWSLDAF